MKKKLLAILLSALLLLGITPIKLFALSSATITIKSVSNIEGFKIVVSGTPSLVTGDQTINLTHVDGQYDIEAIDNYLQIEDNEDVEAVIAYPSSGYKITGWKETGGSTISGTIYKSGNVTLEPIVEVGTIPSSYKLTVSFDNTKGSVKADGASISSNTQYTFDNLHYNLSYECMYYPDPDDYGPTIINLFDYTNDHEFEAIPATGYNFVGWKFNGSTLSTLSNYVDDDLRADSTLEALFSSSTPATTYEVTYDANGATSGTAPSSQTKTEGEDLTLATNAGSLAKTGYTFTGWNTSSDGTGDHYDAGATYSTDSDLALYAEWTSGTSVTISDILNTVPGGFPTTQSSGWVAQDGSKIYIDGSNLTSGGVIMAFNDVLTPDGDNYTISPSFGYIFIFIMQSGVLSRIDKQSLGQTVSYYPYTYTNPSISKPVGYTGDVEFITNGKYTDQSTTPVTVTVDSAPLTYGSDFEVTTGSTHVKLKGSYVSTLAVGTHTLKVGMTGYDDITTEFTITEIPPTPTPAPIPTPSPSSGSSSNRYVVPNTGVCELKLNNNK